MRNVEYSIVDDVLNIKVDLNGDFGPSDTGKSITIGTTDGFEKLHEHSAWFRLNCNRKLNAL